MNKSKKIKSNQILVFEERGKPEYPGKNLSEQSRQPKTQSTYDAGYGNRTRDTLVEGGCSHHCANPVKRKGNTYSTLNQNYSIQGLSKNDMQGIKSKKICVIARNLSR